MKPSSRLVDNRPAALIQRRLREIQLGNMGKEGAANIQKEARKEVQQQSAMNQSQMIEQRKDRRGPIE